MHGLTMPHRRLMRANHRCVVVIRQVRGACSRAVWSSRLCGRCAVVRSAFSETAEPFRSRANSLLGANWPIAPWPIRSLELSLLGPFAPRPFRSRE